MKRRRKSLSMPIAVALGAAAGAMTAGLALWLGREALAEALSIGLVVTLVLLLPGNGLLVRREMNRAEAEQRLPPRAALYAGTAAVWTLLAAVAAFVGLTLGAPDPSWLALPATSDALAGFAAAVTIPAALWAWTRTIPHRPERARKLRPLYERGTHLVAPRTPGELARFRLMALFSSTGEEIAYRWFLLLALAAAAPLPAAIALSVAAFALAHLYQGWLATALVAAFGLAATLLTLASGSIWPAALLHVLWNQAVAGALYTLYREPQEHETPR